MRKFIRKYIINFLFGKYIRKYKNELLQEDLYYLILIFNDLNAFFYHDYTNNVVTDFGWDIFNLIHSPINTVFSDLNNAMIGNFSEKNNLLIKKLILKSNKSKIRYDIINHIILTK